MTWKLRRSRCGPPSLYLASLILALPVLLAALTTPCDPAQQRAALSLLYKQSGGPAWFNSSGWSDPDVSLSCMAGLTPLPSHCCWFGVSCCTPETCTDAAETACNCTIGLVTALSLPANNVGRCHPYLPICLSVCHASMGPCPYAWRPCNCCTASPCNDQLQIISSSAASSAASLANNFRAIGTSLACNLMDLDLSQNSLSGTVPFQISALSQLQTLNMAYNRLSGT